MIMNRIINPAEAITTEMKMIVFSSIDDVEGLEEATGVVAVSNKILLVAAWGMIIMVVATLMVSSDCEADDGEWLKFSYIHAGTMSIRMQKLACDTQLNSRIVRHWIIQYHLCHKWMVMMMTTMMDCIIPRNNILVINLVLYT